MRFCVLGSGSKGNATLVTAGETALLIDAGFSGVEIERRLDAAGIAPAAIGAILITHEHGDHVKGAGIFSRRHQVPVMVNAATRAAAGKPLENLHACQEFETGRAFTVGPFHVHPFATSHDTADPVGFRIEANGRALGYCTDTGIASKLIEHHLRHCHGLIIECNHDPDLLKISPYPPATQQRIRSKGGHLANHQACELLANLLHHDLHHVVLAHISETNNRHDLVTAAIEDHLAADLTRHGIRYSLAYQDRIGEVICL